MKLKVRNFGGLIPTFVEVTGEKLVGKRGRGVGSFQGTTEDGRWFALGKAITSFYFYVLNLREKSILETSMILNEYIKFKYPLQASHLLA